MAQKVRTMWDQKTYSQLDGRNVRDQIQLDDLFQEIKVRTWCRPRCEWKKSRLYIKAPLPANLDSIKNVGPGMPFVETLTHVVIK